MATTPSQLDSSRVLFLGSLRLIGFTRGDVHDQLGSPVGIAWSLGLATEPPILDHGANDNESQREKDEKC
jgi:hypothetical protein